MFSNAADHGGDEVDVTVGSAHFGDDAGFYVADDGPGFSESDPSVVFEEGHTGREDGTGYGLAIVEAVVEAHGWTVSAGESESGGARFEVAGVEFEPAAVE
ncbi:MAG: sensor histidine kinase [Halobacterium sp.]